jgi:hypothetical protein
MGVLQEISVRRLGFPVRVPVREFAATYAPVVGVSMDAIAVEGGTGDGEEANDGKEQQEEWRKICVRILENKPAQEGMSGYLLKQRTANEVGEESEGGGWERWYFVLRDAWLSYYTEEAAHTKGDKPQGALLLGKDSEVLVEAGKNGVSATLLVVTAGVTALMVQMEDGAGVEKWVKYMRKKIEMLKVLGDGEEEEGGDGADGVARSRGQQQQKEKEKEEDWMVGRTTVFLREGHLQKMGGALYIAKRHAASSAINAAARAWCTRRLRKKREAAVLVLQTASRGFVRKKKARRFMETVVSAQARARMVVHRRRQLARKKAVVMLAARIRGTGARREYVLKQGAVNVLQNSLGRAIVTRRKYQRGKHAILVLQARTRSRQPQLLLKQARAAVRLIQGVARVRNSRNERGRAILKRRTAASRLVNWTRGSMQRLRFVRIRASMTAMQALARSTAQRQWYKREVVRVTTAVVEVQRMGRGMVVRVRLLLRVVSRTCRGWLWVMEMPPFSIDSLPQSGKSKGGKTGLFGRKRKVLLPPPPVEDKEDAEQEGQGDVKAKEKSRRARVTSKATHGRHRTMTTGWKGAPWKRRYFELFPLAPPAGGGGDAEASTNDAGIRTGVKVTIDGLKSKPQHNGASATVVSFDSTSGRWHVQMDDGKTLALKPINLIATEGKHISNGASDETPRDRASRAEFSLAWYTEQQHSRSWQFSQEVLEAGGATASGAGVRGWTWRGKQNGNATPTNELAVREVLLATRSCCMKIGKLPGLDDGDVGQTGNGMPLLQLRAVDRTTGKLVELLMLCCSNGQAPNQPRTRSTSRALSFARSIRSRSSSRSSPPSPSFEAVPAPTASASHAYPDALAGWAAELRLKMIRPHLMALQSRQLSVSRLIGTMHEVEGGMGGRALAAGWGLGLAAASGGSYEQAQRQGQEEEQRQEEVVTRLRLATFDRIPGFGVPSHEREGGATGSTTDRLPKAKTRTRAVSRPGPKVMTAEEFVKKVYVLVEQQQRKEAEEFEVKLEKQAQLQGRKLSEPSAAALAPDRATRDAFAHLVRIAAGKGRGGGVASQANATTGGSGAAGGEEASVPFRVLLQLPQIRELAELTKGELLAVGEFVWRKSGDNAKNVKSKIVWRISGDNAQNIKSQSSWQKAGAVYGQFKLFLELIDGLLRAKELAIDEAADSAAEAAEAAEAAVMVAVAAVAAALAAEEERDEYEDAFSTANEDAFSTANEDTFSTAIDGSSNNRSNGAMLQSFKSKKEMHSGRGRQQQKKRQQQQQQQKRKQGSMKAKRKTHRQSLLVDMGEIYGSALHRDSEVLGFSPMTDAD